VSRMRLPLLLLLLTALAFGCSSYQPPKVENARQPRETGMRQDCNTIMGTVFHSNDERVWFEQNCSRWPAVPGIPQTSRSSQSIQGGSAVIQAEPPECIAQRGKPYSSDAQRPWFLAHCLGQPAVAAPQVRPEVTGPAVAQASAEAAPATALPLVPAPQPTPATTNPAPPAVIPTPPRQSVVAAPTSVPTPAPTCDAIRRNANPTDTERRWYFVNCNY
jgi:hypothetical protein